jgi:putative glycosyltransferase
MKNMENNYGSDAFPKLTIVTTLYCSSPYLKAFYKRICSAAENITVNFELIFVDDGSPDDSLQVALDLHRSDSRVRVIELSRNFGHHKAIMTGLAHSRGKYVFLIDSDLEEAPELLNKFYKELFLLNADVVYGIQNKRKGKFFERISGTIFYRLFNFLSSDPIPEDQTTARIMSRQYVEALVAHQEREVCLLGLCSIAGFKQAPLSVDKSSRVQSSYTFGKKIDLAIRAITSFSDKPLIMIFYLGTLILILSGAQLLFIVCRKLIFGVQIKGYTSLIVSVWFLGGLTIFALGVIGIYLARTYIESKQRPYTVIRSIYDTNNEWQTPDKS